MDDTLMVFYRQSRTLYVVSSTIFYDTCTLDESIWHKCLSLPFSECYNNFIHRMGDDKNSSAVKPENFNYPDPSAYNIIMVYKRYGFYV